MTDTITAELTTTDGIEQADSWPTGTTNEGPEEYGILYSNDQTETEIIDTLTALLIRKRGPGFHLENIPDTHGKYDSIVVVHYHPLATLLSTFFETCSNVSSYGLSWDPTDIEECYDDSPNRYLTKPDQLDGYFETTDLDYDTVLDKLHSHLSNNTDATLDVDTADSDHCSFAATFS